MTWLIVLGIVLFWLYCGYGCTRALYLHNKEMGWRAPETDFIVFIFLTGPVSIAGALSVCGWRNVVEGFTFYHPKERAKVVRDRWNVRAGKKIFRVEVKR